MEKKQPFVSIIIVNYNNTADTIACLESIKKIEYKAFNVIVVDNHSSDTSRLEEYIKASPFQLLLLKDNLGFAGGNNAGIRFALEHTCQIDYFLLLNNDTVVDEAFLAPLVVACEEDSSVGATCSQINYYDQPNSTWYGGGEISWRLGKVSHRTSSNANPFRDSEDFLTGCVFLFPKKIINEIGFLSQRYFLYFEDVAYSMDIRNAGYKLKYVSDSIVYHKVSATTGYRSPLSNYYGTRNNLLFMAEYSSKYNFVIFYIYFLVKNVVKYLFYLIKGKKFKMVRAALVAAFIDFSLHMFGKSKHTFR